MSSSVECNEFMRKYSIWIEAEQWPPGQWNRPDDNSDVKVSFQTGEEWVATFFTYKNLFTLRKKNEFTGECLNGRYFWASNMILVDELTRERIEEVVAHLLLAGEFKTAFSQVHK